MFAKRQSTLAATAGLPPPERGFRTMAARLMRQISRPPVAAGLASVVLIGSAATFIAVLGDPFAGAPSARVGLQRQSPEAASAPTGAEAFSFDTYGLYSDLMSGDYDPDALGAGGEALITLPEGGYAAVSGAVRYRSEPLTPAPISGLSQPGPSGPLPVISSDGRAPAQAYARPFTPNGQPRVALVVGGLGLNAATTRAAIERLPPEVTLSFVPYADGLQAWIDLARANGHEVLIEIPMEPQGYPDNDPGPYTLLAQASGEDIQRRMEWLMGRASGYFGVINYLGDAFVTSDQGMNSFMGILRQRGLAFIDDGTARRRTGAFSRASATRIIDEVQSPDAILAQLGALEAAARESGEALGTGFSYPVTVEAAARWIEGLQGRGIQLAPASALARRPGRTSA